MFAWSQAFKVGTNNLDTLYKRRHLMNRYNGTYRLKSFQIINNVKIELLKRKNPCFKISSFKQATKKLLLFYHYTIQFRKLSIDFRKTSLKAVLG